MDLWYTEDFHGGVRLSVRVERVLATAQSPYQRIDVLETRDFGRMLVLDGKVQACQADEFIYHEMLVHLPLLSHPWPRRVLVVGGGDGGAMREVMAHSCVEQGLLVDIDEKVIALCHEHMPSLSASLEGEERLEVVARDASEYIREVEGLDVVLVDSSDPVGPSERLFSGTFYRDLKSALAPGGVVALQAGSPFFYREQIASALRDLRGVFAVVRPYLIPMPTYPSGTWMLAAASDEVDPAAVRVEELARRAADRGVARLRYYTPAVHHAAMVLPPFVEELILSSPR